MYGLYLVGICFSSLNVFGSMHSIVITSERIEEMSAFYWKYKKRNKNYILSKQQRLFQRGQLLCKLWQVIYSAIISLKLNSFENATFDMHFPFYRLARWYLNINLTISSASYKHYHCWFRYLQFHWIVSNILKIVFVSFNIVFDTIIIEQSWLKKYWNIWLLKTVIDNKKRHQLGNKVKL